MQVRGYSHPDFRSLRNTVRRCAPARGPGGVALAVYHRGELVADLACGTRNREGDPFEPETLALSMSTGKGVMATLLHLMVDQAAVDHDVEQGGHDAFPRRHAQGQGLGLKGIALSIARAAREVRDELTSVVDRDGDAALAADGRAASNGASQRTKIGMAVPSDLHALK